MVTEGPRPISYFEFYAKVGQRMINLLGTRMLSGILYQVDMRLRPSGRSGFLVSEFSAYQGPRQAKESASSAKGNAPGSALAESRGFRS